MDNWWEILASILIMLIFEFIDWWLGEAQEELFAKATPVVFLIASFLIIWWALRYYQERNQDFLRQLQERVDRSLANHLPEGYFIRRNPNRLKEEMVYSVKTADKFIVTTGSRASDEEYLSAIENRVLRNSRLEYWRVLMGEHKIHHRLHEHISQLKGCKNVHIRWLKEEHYGFILGTEDRVVLPFADPLPGEFGTAQVIPNKEIAGQYKEVVLRLYGEAVELKDEDVTRFCEKCNPRNRV